MIKSLRGPVSENVRLFIHIHHTSLVNSTGGLCTWLLGLIFLLVCIFNGVIIPSGLAPGYLRES